MKWYGSAPGASMHMHEDPALISRLEDVIRFDTIDVAIETGTYLGTGSTRFIAEAFERTRTPKVFHTIEVNYEAAMQAKTNLARFPFVKPLWGSSVNIESAAKWLEQDPVLLNPWAYPDIWIDHIDQENSARHYAAEMRGSSAWKDRPEWDGENLLEKLLVQHRDDRPLVILDSAGGIGWLEFTTTLGVMSDRPYYLLLDDVQHVKHFRSRDHIHASPDFHTLAESRKALLVEHQPKKE